MGKRGKAMGRAEAASWEELGLHSSEPGKPPGMFPGKLQTGSD